MRIDVVTLFPEMFEPFAHISMVGRALDAGALHLRLRSPREFGIGKHRSVDDTPYGGGPGMVMRVDCLVACLESLDADSPALPDGSPAGRAHRVLLCPQGQALRQARVYELAVLPALCLVCGRYEGVDERVREHVDEELSLGDFVLSGGEIAAMAIIDTCARLLPGVLGNPESLTEESHSPATGGMLEYPQYTRPAEYRGRAVPEVLQGGNHAQIAAWRKERARDRTAQRRPDLLGQAPVAVPGAVPGAAHGAAPRSSAADKEPR
jgi:tRNA (guanine37-N1)-methyltransferase